MGLFFNARNDAYFVRLNISISKLGYYFKQTSTEIMD